MATKREELGSAELLRKLRLAISNQAEEVPEGWKTAAQWSQEWNVTHNAAGIVLGKSTKLGLMECRKPIGPRILIRTGMSFDDSS